ncbi:hypothetical protein RhiirA4_419795 [Rhizophagus irregularis]|uniref:Uncharacterized protein n=1 Tax=Rhizophagus irregularis TaxID=588596 RepID=A0A2I1GFI5_9GLOM|nr:hypothetical protein RhiirA4_419795 [Rhizophagus irregularis]
MSKRKAVYNNQVEVETGTKKNPRTLAKKRREMNIEETNQLLLEKEVIVEDDVRDKSEEEDEEDEEEDDDDNDNDKLGAAKTVLDLFQFCTKLDICNWLLKNPDILRLANEMNESSYVVSSKNTKDKIRFWDESVKCLFLRARNPSSEALDDLVVKIFQFKIYTRVRLEIFHKKKLKNTYIDENVMQKLLNHQLAAVNVLELTNNGGIDTLVEFVKEAVRVSWDGKNLSGIKELDTMTKNLIIPFRSGSDIVNTLKQSMTKPKLVGDETEIFGKKSLARFISFI